MLDIPINLHLLQMTENFTITIFLKDHEAGQHAHYVHALWYNL